MSYLVPPGLYAIGQPDDGSPVLVTANYKMSYDLLRGSMRSENIWLLVLETYGINVWCAAGKGTFGTGELVRRLELSGLAQVVSHRRLLLPIMGAAGIKAIEVRKRSGFEVQFAALHIQDMQEYLHNGMQTTPRMRELTFTAKERLVLIPIELVTGVKSLLYGGLPLSLVSGLSGHGFSMPSAGHAFAQFVAAVLCGTVLVPLLLPVLPGRMFALKGAISGVAVSVLISLLFAARPLPERVALVLFATALSAFYAMNFTGSTPFTSPSGVRREIRRSMPVMGVASVLAVILLIGARWWS